MPKHNKSVKREALRDIHKDDDTKWLHGLLISPEVTKLNRQLGLHNINMKDNGKKKNAY